MMSRTVEILDHLIAHPTISSDSNLNLIDWIESALVGWGFDVTRITSPCGQKAGLHAILGPKVAGGICLSGHTDVVPTKGQVWTKPEFKLSRDANRLYGRGTTDMKGFVASALALAERAQSRPLKAPLSLVLSYDEEIGCVGIQDMLPKLAPLLGKPKLVIVGEPTSMQVAIGHKGKAALDVDCWGEAGHSALAPQFTNAIHVALDFVDQIRALQTELSSGLTDPAYDIPYSTVHVGKISGGQALNIVPDHVTLAMEYRYVGNAGQDIHHSIQSIADKTSRKFSLPKPITIQQVNAYPGLDVDPANAVIDLAQTLIQGGKTTKVAFGTEAGFFASMGLDTVVIGPGDMALDGHKPDEGLSITELESCDQMMNRILADLTDG